MLRPEKTCLSLVCIILLTHAIWRPQLAVAQAAAADFEAGLVQEAVDLSAASSEGLPDDQKEMESLLHWAIGRSYHTKVDLSTASLRILRLQCSSTHPFQQSWHVLEPTVSATALQ